MTRIKGGVQHTKKRKSITKRTKGFMWGRKSKIKLAKVAKMKAGQYAYNSRKTKKRINRGLWNININAAVRELGLTYSTFMSKLKKNNILLDRKVLADIASNQPKIMEELVSKVK